MFKIYIFVFIVMFFILRTLYILIRINNRKQTLENVSQWTNLRTVIIYGSGGHTMEMLRLVKELNKVIFQPKYYVIASSDIKSKEKLQRIEHGEKYNLYEIPRSRNVHQSYISSIYTTLFSILHCVPFMIKTRPDVIICNGPGTCIPICIIGFILRILFLSNCYIVFVESICRVKNLSLSGQILYYLADVFLVQWTDLLYKYKRAKYIGRF